MSNKIVLVHRCFDARMDGNPGGQCKCQRRITNHEAELMVQRGDAIWVTFRTRSGYYVPDYRQIAILCRKPGTERMRARTIERVEMEALTGMYGSFAERYQQERVEAYNSMTLAERERWTVRWH